MGAKEETKAQDESPSFPTEPGKVHLMNARGIWDPKAKLGALLLPGLRSRGGRAMMEHDRVDVASPGGWTATGGDGKAGYFR